MKAGRSVTGDLEKRGEKQKEVLASLRKVLVVIYLGIMFEP